MTSKVNIGGVWYLTMPEAKPLSLPKTGQTEEEHKNAKHDSNNDLGGYILIPRSGARHRCRRGR